MEDLNTLRVRVHAPTLNHTASTPESQARQYEFGSVSRSYRHTASPPLFPPSTLWIPLDELAHTWADFGKEAAASAHALVATGTAFLALSWEASALRNHTLAWQEQQQYRTRNAARYYGHAIEGLTSATREWSRVVLWLERLANNSEQCDSYDLEQVRAMIGLATEQQRRLWTLTQEVQQELLDVGGGPLAQQYAPTTVTQEVR